MTNKYNLLNVMKKVIHLYEYYALVNILNTTTNILKLFLFFYFYQFTFFIIILCNDVI